MALEKMKIAEYTSNLDTDPEAKQKRKRKAQKTAHENDLFANEQNQQKKPKSGPVQKPIDRSLPEIPSTMKSTCGTVPKFNQDRLPTLKDRETFDSSGFSYFIYFKLIIKQFIYSLAGKLVPSGGFQNITEKFENIFANHNVSDNSQDVPQREGDLSHKNTGSTENPSTMNAQNKCSKKGTLASCELSGSHFIASTPALKIPYKTVEKNCTKI